MYAVLCPSRSGWLAGSHFLLIHLVIFYFSLVCGISSGVNKMVGFIFLFLLLSVSSPVYTYAMDPSETIFVYFLFTRKLQWECNCNGLLIDQQQERHENSSRLVVPVYSTVHPPLANDKDITSLYPTGKAKHRIDLAIKHFPWVPNKPAILVSSLST